MRGFLNKVFGGAALLIVSVTGFSGIEDSLKFVMADLVLLEKLDLNILDRDCLLYTSPSPRDGSISRMPSSA